MPNSIWIRQNNKQIISVNIYSTNRIKHLFKDDDLVSLASSLHVNSVIILTNIVELCTF